MFVSKKSVYCNTKANRLPKKKKNRYVCNKHFFINFFFYSFYVDLCEIVITEMLKQIQSA